MSDLSRADPDFRLFCAFPAEHRLYGIDVVHVREVCTPLPITPVPQAPQAVRGVVNLRSRIYLLLDLRPLLGLEPVECTEQRRLIILRPQIAENLGILVDGGGDIIRAPVDQIESASQPESSAAESASGGAAAVHAGVCKLPNGLMVILDPARIVDAVSKLIAPRLASDGAGFAQRT